MKVLSIGNSFSQDAQRYFAEIAREFDPDVKAVNLYIGGCSLVRHYNNIINDLNEYTLEENGVSTGMLTSIKFALLSDDWDVVTLQEVSTRSTNVRNFDPYISFIAKYVRELCPKAKIALHETWGYESNTHSIKNQGYFAHSEMFKDIENAYISASKLVNADIILHSGRVLKLLDDQGIAVHRDGVHASRGIGRYALALVWVRSLYGVKINRSEFNGFDEPISDEDCATVKAIVDGLAI